MTLDALGQDPLEMPVEQALRRLSEGEPPSRIEVERVDVKEEPGRRGAGGTVSPGNRERSFFYVPADSGEDQRNITGIR